MIQYVAIVELLFTKYAMPSCGSKYLTKFREVVFVNYPHPEETGMNVCDSDLWPG